MARQVKITLTSDHTEVLNVADKTTLSDILLNGEGDEFIAVPTLGGGEYVFRKSHILSMVKETKTEAAVRERRTPRAS